MKTFRSVYHFVLAGLGAFLYRFPSRRLFVIGVTGTKGKTTTTELINAVLEAAGRKTALASTLRFKISEKSQPNRMKMTMPGRLFLQKFLRQAVSAGCQYAILEMTSEGARQYRHRFIDLDALVFTNLALEHIESHGSYENYLAAKLKIAEQLERSSKTNKIILANGDDKEAERFLAVDVARKIKYRASEVKNYSTSLPGEFNRQNIAAAAALGRALGIEEKVIRRAIENFRGVRGRMEKVVVEPFQAIVDYAHTSDSLEKAYQALAGRSLICVLGSCGGGRDRWKRPVLGEIAERYCQQIILTDEDPYDEDPRQIVEEVAAGIKSKKYEIVMDRREAIAQALQLVKPGEAIIITGKGTDPYIMGPRGSKTPWDDATVVREEYARITGS